MRADIMQNIDIERVQRSFGKIALLKEVVTAQFYERLFELDGGLRPLFKADVRAQGEKLMSTLAMAVRNLKTPELIRDSIQDGPAPPHLWRARSRLRHGSRRSAMDPGNEPGNRFHARGQSRLDRGLCPGGRFDEGSLTLAIPTPLLHGRAGANGGRGCWIHFCVA